MIALIVAIGCDGSERIADPLGGAGDFGSLITDAQLPPIGLAEMLFAEEDSHGGAGLGELELGGAELIQGIGLALLEGRAHTGNPLKEICQLLLRPAHAPGRLGGGALNGAELFQPIEGATIVGEGIGPPRA